MEKLRFEAFLDTQSTEQKGEGEIIGLAKEIHGNFDKESIESYVGNATLNDIAKR